LPLVNIKFQEYFYHVTIANFKIFNVYIINFPTANLQISGLNGEIVEITQDKLCNIRKGLRDSNNNVELDNRLEGSEAILNMKKELNL